MNIRNAVDQDSQTILELHIDSIRNLCSKHYSEDSIKQWIDTRSADTYKNLSPYRTLIVGEKNSEIVGFSLMDLEKQFVICLFVSPQHIGKQYGKSLLNRVEEIAKNNSLNELFLYSTLNAAGFYRRLGYIGEEISRAPLACGLKLDSIKMSKKIL